MKRILQVFAVAVSALLCGGWYLSIPVEEDLRFPSSGINPPGAASDPTRSTTTGLLEFSGTADNIIAGNFQMPHAWKAGSRIVPHLHVLTPNSASGATSRWKIEYVAVNIGGVLSADYGTGMYNGTATVTLTAPANNRTHTLLSFGDVTMTGITESAVVFWRVSRLAASDGADTDTGAIVLGDFDTHFYVEKFGKNI